MVKNKEKTLSKVESVDTMTAKIMADSVASKRTVIVATDTVQFKAVIDSKDSEPQKVCLWISHETVEDITPDSLRDMAQALLTLAAKVEEK